MEKNSNPDEVIWTADWLEEKIEHENPRVRLWALNRLMYCYPDRTPSVCRRLLQDEDSFVRQNAISALGTHGEPSDRDPLRKLYPDASPTEQGAILKALGKLNDAWILETGRELLQAEQFNVNLIISFVDALDMLDHDEKDEVAQDMFAETRLEAVFSRLLPVVLSSSGPEQTRWVTDQTLRKFSADYMIKPRPFRRTMQQHLQLLEHPSTVRDFLNGDLPATDLPASLRSDLEHQSFAVDLSSAIAEGCRQYERENRGKALETIGNWMAERNPTEEPETDRSRRLTAFGASFQNLPDNFVETDVPGNPVRELFFLLTTAAVHSASDFDPERIMAQAREQNRFPDRLYRLNSNVLLDEIPALAPETTPDPKPIRSDAERVDSPFVRAKAIRVLSHLDDPETVPLCVTALSSEHPVVYQTATECLVEKGTPAVEEISRRLSDRSLDDGIVTAADVLRRIPVNRSSEVFLNHFDFLVESVGPDPIVPFAVDLAVRETVEHLRDHLDRNVLLIGEQLGIVADLFDVDLPNREEIENRMEEEARQFQGGPGQGRGGPFPGGTGGMRPEPGGNPDRPDPGNPQ